MSDADEMSFEILGTTSINSYDGNTAESIASARNSMNNSSGVNSELSRMRLSTSTSGSNLAPKSPLSPSLRSSSYNKENRQDVALDILMRRKSPSLVKLPSLNVEFPSLSSANLTEEDITKLQTIIAEHQQLKENLLKANSVIRQYFSSVEKWQNDVKRAKEEDQRTIALLTANNQKLQQELRQLEEGQQQQQKGTTHAKQPPVETLNQEQELRALKQELIQSKEAAKEMVTKQTFKQVERQCSQLLAENLQFKDMEQQYIDTINCLKVNHASTEELVRMGQVDLNAERAANHKLMGEFNSVKEENQVLIQQAEIYQKDFIAERDARQRMAGEKDEVITELNRLRMMLQAMPQQQQQQQQPQHANAGHYGLVRYTCPGCYAQFNSQQVLGQHLTQCGRQS